MKPKDRNWTADMAELSEEEHENMRLEELLELARDRSAAGRAHLLGAVGQLYCDDDAVLGLRERRLMEDILRQLVGEVERSVRKALAERLATSSTAPPELIWRLANDEAEVAFPILARSSLLSDSELVDIVRHKTTQHRLAIAGRKPVTIPVSSALVETGEESVLTTLLGNVDAHLSPEAFARLSEIAQECEALQTPLLSRSDLPGEVARRMYWYVSAALRQHLMARFDIDTDTLDRTIESTVLALTPEVKRGDIRPKPGLAEAAAALMGDGTPAPEILTQLMREGRFDLFEIVLARALDLRLTMLRRVLYEPGGQALAVGLRAIGTSKPDFAAIFLWSRRARPGDKLVADDELARALRFYERISIPAACNVLRRWQRDADYQAAIDAIGREGAA